MKRIKINWLVLCCIIILSITAIIAGKCLELISSELLIRNVISMGIDYEEFRNIRIDKTKLDKIQKYTHNLLVSNNDLNNISVDNNLYIDENSSTDNNSYIDENSLIDNNSSRDGNSFIGQDSFINEIGYLTFAMMLSDYDMLSGAVPNEKIFLRGIGRVSQTKAFQELYLYYKGIFTDLRYFPVPIMGKGANSISYEDSWYAPRSYGGYRSHEGTDIMAGNNTRGYYPILSITDGIVENLGWLEQGGYRIGIRGPSGGYFYYAHLHTYAPELKPGDFVIAGQLLGFMGDSGYGSEGTIGQFDVHLHLGIYLGSNNSEISVNPYYILKILEYNRTELAH